MCARNYKTFNNNTTNGNRCNIVKCATNFRKPPVFPKYRDEWMASRESKTNDSVNTSTSDDYGLTNGTRSMSEVYGDIVLKTDIAKTILFFSRLYIVDKKFT